MTTPKTKRRLADLPPAQHAGILCNDKTFRRFAAHRNGIADTTFSVTAAAEFLRHQCQIDSRRDLNTTPAAQTRFDALRAEFDAWAGRAPQPR